MSLFSTPRSASSILTSQQSTISTSLPHQTLTKMVKVRYRPKSGERRISMSSLLISMSSIESLHPLAQRRNSCSTGHERSETALPRTIEESVGYCLIATDASTHQPQVRVRRPPRHRKYGPSNRRMKTRHDSDTTRKAVTKYSILLSGGVFNNLDDTHIRGVVSILHFPRISANVIPRSRPPFPR